MGNICNHVCDDNRRHTDRDGKPIPIRARDIRLNTNSDRNLSATGGKSNSLTTPEKR